LHAGPCWIAGGRRLAIGQQFRLRRAHTRSQRRKFSGRGTERERLVDSRDLQVR
jgi:hypothetical protein